MQKVVYVLRVHACMFVCVQGECARVCILCMCMYVCMYSCLFKPSNRFKFIDQYFITSSVSLIHAHTRIINNDNGKNRVLYSICYFWSITVFPFLVFFYSKFDPEKNILNIAGLSFSI